MDLQEQIMDSYFQDSTHLYNNLISVVLLWNDIPFEINAILNQIDLNLVRTIVDSKFNQSQIHTVIAFRNFETCNFIKWNVKAK